MPQYSYIPDRSNTIHVITVANPVEEKIAILDDLAHGGSTNYDHRSLHRDGIPRLYSEDTTGLYEVQIDDGFVTGTCGYMYLKDRWRKRVTIESGAVNSGIALDRAENLTAALMFAASEAHRSSVLLDPAPQLELPLESFTCALGSQFTFEALREELSERYPWLLKSE